MDGKATVLKLSIFSFLLASAGSSHNNIISYIFENLDLPQLGPAALLCRYLSYSASTLLAPSLKFKLKYQFLLVSALYCLNFFLGIIATNITEPSIVYWIICGGYILEGFASGINWVAEGRYLHLICEIFNIHKNRGHILGLHQFVRCCSLLGGAVITYLCIGFFNNTIYFCTLLIFGIISMIYAFYAIKEVDEVGRSELEAIEREGGNEQRTKEIIDILHANKEENKNEGAGALASLKSIFGFFPLVYYVFPFLTIYGLSVGIKMNIIRYMIPSWVQPAQRNQVAGICQLIIGVGSMLGSYIASYLTDHIGTLLTSRLSILLFSACEIVMFTFQVQSLEVGYLIGFVWGVTCHAFLGLYSVICSRHLGGKKEVFALNRLVYTLSIMLYQLDMTYSGSNITYETLFVLRSCCVLSFFLLAWLPAPQLHPEPKKGK